MAKKRIRKGMKSIEKSIAKHQRLIRAEEKKLSPNAFVIEYWKKEVRAMKDALRRKREGLRRKKGRK